MTVYDQLDSESVFHKFSTVKSKNVIIWSNMKRIGKMIKVPNFQERF